MVAVTPPLVPACPECQGLPVTDPHTGDVVCSACGLILEDGLIIEQDKRMCTPVEREQRARATTPINPRGEATSIGWGGSIPTTTLKDCHGAPVQNPQMINRLRRWHSRTLRSPVRTAILGDNDIVTLCAALDLPPKVIARVTRLYDRFRAGGHLLGRSSAIIIPACVVIACRATRVGYLQEDVQRLAKISRSDLHAGIITVRDALHVRLPPPSPASFIEPICSKLDLSVSTRQQACALAGTAGKVCGRSPVALAAAAIYLVSVQVHEKRTQRDIAFAAGITEVTLRNNLPVYTHHRHEHKKKDVK